MEIQTEFNATSIIVEDEFDLTEPLEIEIANLSGMAEAYLNFEEITQLYNHLGKLLNNKKVGE